MTATETKQWVSPKIELIGRIGDVAGADTVNNAQTVNTCGGGVSNGQCKS